MVLSLRVAILSSLVVAILFDPKYGLAQPAPDLVKDGNRWEITDFVDNSSTHVQWATQGVCFKYLGTSGTHLQYIWWSDTYPDWNGIASQEGDQVFMHGDFWKDEGHDTMQWDIVTSSPRNIGAGHWTEWVEDGNTGDTVMFSNALLRRVGECKVSIDEAKKIPLPVDKNGETIKYPAGNIPREKPE